jgi:hypothetical protein
LSNSPGPRGRLGALLALAFTLLAGCAGMPERLAVGTARSGIEERLGRPTAVHALADGTRLQYSRQPAGQQVYNLDLDSQGRLVRLQQVMERPAFEQVLVNSWTQAEVLRQFGQPAVVERVARFDGPVWTYRFLEMGLPRQAHVHLDPMGVVRQLMFTDEMSLHEPPDWLP